MMGKISVDSAELINMEPNKCKSWDWISWEDLKLLRKENEGALFEPMVHLIDGLEMNLKSPFDIA